MAKETVKLKLKVLENEKGTMHRTGVLLPPLEYTEQLKKLLLSPKIKKNPDGTLSSDGFSIESIVKISKLVERLDGANGSIDLERSEVIMMKDCIPETWDRVDMRLVEFSEDIKGL